MADISDMVEFEMADDSYAPFPIGAGGPIMKIMRFFYPIPIHLLHMFTGPVSVYSFFHILRQARGEENMFKKQWDWLRTKKECDRCGGFEHEICPICESRGSLPYESKFAQATWTHFHNPELLEKADEKGREIAEMIGGDAGRLVGRARGLRAHKDELNAELAYSMGKFKALGKKPGTLPCRCCNGEGVIKCQGCKGDAKVVDNWPDIDYYTNGPARAGQQWQMTNPHGQPVTEIEQEFLTNDPYTAKWWTLRKYLVEGYKEHMTPQEKEDAAEEYDRFWWNENVRKSIMDRRPGWKEKLEILKKDDPAWVYNTLEVNPQVAPLLENGDDQRNDPLRLLENFEESPEMRTLRYKVMGPYSKLLEMWGLDPTTMATTKIVPKSERRKIAEEWEKLYGPEAERWNEQKRKTNNFGLPEKLTPDMKTLLFHVPEDVRKFKSEQRGDELAACWDDPAVQDKYAEYLAMMEVGNEDAAREILREVENRVRSLNLTQSAQREAQRQKEREEGLARINQFKQEDVEAGRAAIEAAEQVVPEILEQAPEVSEIEKKVKSIEEQRDAARKRLEALPEPRLFHPKTEEWIHAFQEVKRYEDLHTIESAALVRKLDSIKKNTTVFPVAKERAQMQLVLCEEDRLRFEEERRLGQQISPEHFKTTVIEEWRKKILNKDALAKVFEDLGPDAEDIIFRMAVRERRDEQLEQAHRDAGKLGEREDHYIAVKSVESYEQATSNGWNTIKDLTYPAHQYAKMDELSIIEEREMVRNAAIEARRAKIAKRGQIGTRLAETFQPVTAGVSRVARFAGRVIPKPWEKKGAGRPVDEKTAEARYQKDVERAQKVDEKRLLKEERAQKRRERREQFEKIIEEKVGGAKAFLDEKLFFNKITNLRPENFRLPWGDQRIAPARSRVPDKALVERTAAEADRAAARNAEKIPGVKAAARQKIEKAEARRRKAVEEFEGWKSEFLAKAENRESPFAEARIQARRTLLTLEEERFAIVKRNAEQMVQRAKDDAQFELDKKLAIQALVVKDELEREQLTIPDHVDVRRFLVEDILRKDVVAAIFDKQPFISLGPQNNRLPDYTAHQNEALRESVHAQIEGVKPEQEKAQLIAEAPMKQSNEEMMKVLESARRTFFVETGRPTLDSNPANEKNLWRQQWDKLGQDDWVTKARTSLQLALNPVEKQSNGPPVAFASLNPTLLNFGGPSWQWRK